MTANTPNNIANYTAGDKDNCTAGSNAETANADSRVSFKTLCFLLARIKSARGAHKKTLLAAFVDEWRLSCSPQMPFLRLMMPTLDHRTYNIKERSLADIYLKTLNISPHSLTAKTLINYTDPQLAAGNAGDFPAVLRVCLLDRALTSSNGYSILQINSLLDSIHAANSIKQKVEIIKKISLSLDHLESEWFARIILKGTQNTHTDIKIGMQHASILQIYHPKAFDLFQVCLNLHKVVTDLADKPLDYIPEATIEYGYPFSPQRAVKTTPIDCMTSIKAEFWIETKLDGERMQMHYNNGTFLWFSRAGTPYTYLYGSSYSSGAITKYISGCIPSSINTLVLDGEMMEYSIEKKGFCKFNSLKTAANDTLSLGLSAKSHPCFVVFDILNLNGSVADLPLYERYQLLTRINMIKNRLEILPHSTGETGQHLVDALNACLLRHEEGILVKIPESVYTPGKLHATWFKIKPEYIDSLNDDVDLVIFGASYGTGIRGGKLSRFHCAVIDDTQPITETDIGLKFISFCDIGSGTSPLTTGYSQNDLLQISRETNINWKKFDRNNIPSWLQLSPGVKEYPDMIIHPIHLPVVQVRASEFVKSTVFACGVTLRFPRFIMIRNDKPHADALTLKELLSLSEKKDGQMAHLMTSFDNIRQIKRKAIIKPRTIKIAEHYRMPDTLNVSAVDTIFSGIEFCVCQNEKMTRQEVIILIVEHGGTVVANPSPNTAMIIADITNTRLRNFMTGAKWNIVTSDFICSSVETGRIAEFCKSNVVFATEKTRDLMNANLDSFGDSFTGFVTLEELTILLENGCGAQILGNVDESGIEVSGCPQIGADVQDRQGLGIFPLDCYKAGTNALDRVIKRRKTITEMLSRYFTDANLIEIFGTSVFHIDATVYATTEKSCNAIIDSIIRINGGIIVDSVCEYTTHVISSASGADYMQVMQDEGRLAVNRFHVVSAEWVDASVASNCLADEKRFCVL